MRFTSSLEKQLRDDPGGLRMSVYNYNGGLLRINRWSVVNRALGDLPRPAAIRSESSKHNIYGVAESMKNSRNIYPAFAWFVTPEDRTSRFAARRWRHGETKYAWGSESTCPRGMDQSCNFAHCRLQQRKTNGSKINPSFAYARGKDPLILRWNAISRDLIRASTQHLWIGKAKVCSGFLCEREPPL